MIRNWINKFDLGLLIVSFLIALALWMNVKGERIEIRHFYPFIELQNQPANLAVKSQTPKTLDVMIQGSPTVLNGIHPDMISVVVDVSSLRPGKKLFTLSISRNVILPSVLAGRVEIVRIIPETMEIDSELIKNTVESSPVEK